MTTKHTPGPWRYEAATKTIRAVPANYWLASMDSWDGAVDHAANARLIAAAPDLLAALHSIASNAGALADDRETPQRGLWAGCAEQARAAITKAES